VIIGARDQEAGEKAVAELRKRNIQADAITLDVTSASDHRKAYEFIDRTYGKLDILVNNAGVTLEDNVSEIGPHNTVLEVPTETIRKTYEINILGPIELTRTLLPLIRKAPSGRIVNVSSILGSLSVHADPKVPLVYDYKSFAYGSSKTLVNAFTIYLAHALKDTSIKVNSAHPGWVKTGLGGSNAPLEPSEGGKTSTKLALLGDDGPSGGFFHLGDPVLW
jgi:NAD(P)-dependent dehydrogenase (short-subunit alcohol dehydrogenase family)